MDGQIDAVRESLNSKIDAVRESLDSKIDTVREALDKKVDTARDALEKTIELLDAKIDQRFMWTVGVIIATWLTTMGSTYLRH